MQNKSEHESKELEDKPPVFSTWKGWYLLLIIALIGWIVILSLMTASY